MTHDDVRDLSAEYVLGALDAAARQEVDAHLTGCAACRALLEEDARTFDALGRGIELTPAPVALRERVLRAATREPVVEQLSARVRPRARPLPWILAAAAALVALIAGWQVLALRGERMRLETQASEQQRSLAVLASNDLVRFELSGETPAPARARAFWSHRHGMVFTAEGLAPVPAGRTYQLWVISGGKPISAGVFTSTPTGQARVVMATPLTLTQVDAVAVTVEPEGGRAAPSTQPILAGAAAG